MPARSENDWPPAIAASFEILVSSDFRHLFEEFLEAAVERLVRRLVDALLDAHAIPDHNKWRIRKARDFASALRRPDESLRDRLHVGVR